VRRAAAAAIGAGTALLASIGRIGAQEAPIQDNSFLIEEAYNQEAGIVQHISTFELPDEGSDWAFTFTQEWPAPHQRHQLSFTVPAARVAGESGLGDVAIHYRFQALGVGGGPVAFAPRASLLLPTGDDERGLGSGSAGIEVNLPLSVALADRWVGHWNLGGAVVPDARAADGSNADATAIRLGQSFVFLARPRLNFLLEATWAREESASAGGRTERAEGGFVSPGVRFAVDLPSGLQIVPGIAVPIGFGDAEGDRSIFFYLSLEHPFRG
jgi:hypothetical protein